MFYPVQAPLALKELMVQQQTSTTSDYLLKNNCFDNTWTNFSCYLKKVEKTVFFLQCTPFCYSFHNIRVGGINGPACIGTSILCRLLKYVFV